ncbi:antitoxin Xre/MbcA/ParS toxin-binding domain-containing protein [Flavobacterium sp.]|jgi:putative toxin-antitoxin system antitoxin component (TIGR02293 family)|uniref:type II RES/Xre toxin-antitoxin system antitoxin n=1 Tax=Flavobacterium sp. TaxID=239 RepID=UPI0037C11F37
MLKLVANSDIELDNAVRTFVSKVGKESNLTLVDNELTYKDFLSNKMLIVHSIRQGIPYYLYELIKEKTPFKQEDWADFLGVSERTLVRNKAKVDYVFESIPSEKILELAEVTSLGRDVFDSEKQFYLWLNTPNFALGNLVPFELLKDSYGKEMVMNELHKIDYGIFI